RRELSSKGWRPKVIALSGVTDPYQPAEARFRVTRRCLEVLLEFRNPVSVISKRGLIVRDADVLGELARFKAASCNLSMTTLDPELARKLEPRASAPRDRLAAIGALAKAGVPVGVMAAPIIPGLNDHEMPAILEAAADAGATWAGIELLRLPYGVKEIFERWLAEHYPARHDKVIHQIRSTRGGCLNDGRFGSRMRGEGKLADDIHQLFKLARRRLALDGRGHELSAAAFRRPPGAQPRVGAAQPELFTA
ncbi:MAG: radical SAM protein, partial [Elusimicrobia bacterium]|nr:radical SAM protein [Elusimicrobiota bacterium]